MIIALFVLGCLFSFLFTVLIFHRIDFFKALAYSQGFYYSFYVLVSGILIWINLFSIKKAVFFTLFLLGVFVCVQLVLQYTPISKKIPNLLRSGKEEKLGISFSKSLSTIPLIVILIAGFFLTKDNAGMFALDQDEGSYQMRALFYMNGQTDIVVDFPEFERNAVPGSWYAEYFLSKMDHFAGYYRLKDMGDAVSYGIEANETNGVFHGVYTFPALLALWGSMFGLVHMPGILNLLYLLTLALLWYALENCKVKLPTQTMITALMAVSPVFLWSSKQTLTEILLVMFMTLFLALLLESSKARCYEYSVIPLTAFSFSHILMTVYVPMFGMIYFIAYFISRNRKFLLAQCILMVSYVAGFFMMKKTATYYVYSNYDFLFQKLGNKLNMKNFGYLVAGAAIVVILLSLVLATEKVRKKIRVSFEAFKTERKTDYIFRLVIAGIIVAISIFFVVKGHQYQKNDDIRPAQLGIVSLILSSGFVGFFVAIAGLIYSGKKLFTDYRLAITSWMLLYIAVVFSGVLWILIYYYYYYARYFVAFIPVVMIAIGLSMKNWKPYFALPICLAGIVISIVQNPMIYKEKDLTYVSYESVNDMLQYIKEDMNLQDVTKDRVVVIVNDSIYAEGNMYTMPFKALGVDVIFRNEGAEYNQVFECMQKYDLIYLFTYEVGPYERGKEYYWTPVVQRKAYLSIFDPNNNLDGLPYPLKLVEGETDIALMKWTLY